jgi:ribonucleotide reductase beta subunit family protein with ferritin-like domain
MEEIHGETYGKLIDTYISDSGERDMLFDSMNTIPCVKEKADWAIRWIENPQASFGERLLAFACVEGLFFSGSFAAIFWLRKRNLMPGLTQANSLISRDEGLHQRFACLLYRKYLSQGKPSKERAEQIVREACEIEKRFQTEALPVSLIGMNNRLMKQYIEYVADYLLIMIGQDKVYNSTNPFDFMDLIGMPSNTNQFEKKPTQYIRPLSKKEIDLDDDNF